MALGVGNLFEFLFHFSISLFIFVPIYSYFLIKDTHVLFSTSLFFLPAILLIQLFLVAGLSLIVSMANLFFRDVKYLMTFVLQLWFFATNVMYPIQFNNYPALRWIASANPMIAILTAYRNCIMGQPLQDPVGLLVSALVAMIVFLGGWTMFHKAEFKFAEYV